MRIKTVGSVCSGIEAASLAWKDLDLEFSWFSEIAEFPSKLLKEKYSAIPNLGDMTSIPSKILHSDIDSPDLICGGTPCQAFSVAGWKNGLEDERGNLTLSFVDIIESNDSIRTKKNLPRSIVFWENVEGVLKDKTNAFGSFISSLAGFDETIDNIKWPNAGIVRGPIRNIAWRVIDAKYFGVPQQRKRLYVLAGGKDFYPEDILFEESNGISPDFPSYELTFSKNNINFEVFREYTDVLYSAYGTKWNGNAAAYNGSLFISQDNRLRRLSPLECERLMGFPDDYTNIEGAKRTNRYQALGNSWAVPVIKWIGKNILNHSDNISKELNSIGLFKESSYQLIPDKYICFGNMTINTSEVTENPIYSTIFDIVDINPPSQIYISPVGCSGILRRKEERGLKMNSRLEQIMTNIANEMSVEEIERQSRRQNRGAFSMKKELEKTKQINLFEVIP